MRLGALLGPVSDGARPRALADQARAYADGGYESLWSAQAIGRGFMYTDPFIALTVAATVTDGLELGTAVVQVPLYHPADLAHRVFSLMQIAGDRFRFGVGAGSTVKDFAAYDRDYGSRFATLDESLVDLRRLFAEGSRRSAELSPWPAVLGGPPILLGSWGKRVERAAAEFDGWIASAAYRAPEQVVAALDRYRAAGGGRAVVSTLQLGPDSDLGQTRAELQRFDAAGFDDAVVMFLPGGPTPAAVRALID